MNPAEQVRALLVPVLEARGLELFDVEWTGGLLRVSIDRPAGVDLDAIGDASTVVSELLDGIDPDPFPGRYVLEVSSPGLERPLRTPAHFRRFVGSKVSIKTRPGVDGERRLTGVLDAADDDGCVIDGRRLDYSDIERARTVFEWGGEPRAGGTGRGPERSNGKRAKAGAASDRPIGDGAPGGAQRKARA